MNVRNLVATIMLVSVAHTMLGMEKKYEPERIHLIQSSSYLKLVEQEQEKVTREQQEKIEATQEKKMEEYILGPRRDCITECLNYVCDVQRPGFKGNGFAEFFMGQLQQYYRDDKEHHLVMPHQDRIIRSNTLGRRVWWFDPCLHDIKKAVGTKHYRSLLSAFHKTDNKEQLTSPDQAELKQVSLTYLKVHTQRLEEEREHDEKCCAFLCCPYTFPCWLYKKYEQETTSLIKK